MRNTITTLTIILTITLLTILPSSYIGVNRAHAVDQTAAVTNWLPFGPYTDQIIYSYYSDFGVMFSTFTTGGANGIDLTDWPAFPNQQAALCGNVDFFCGSQQANFGLDQVDINHHNNFLGVAQLVSRVTAPVGASISSTAAGCSTGFGSVTVTLHNQETGVVDMEQKFNNMTLIQVLTGGVLGSATVVSGMTSATLGTYAFPCVVAGNYLLSNNEYANCATQAACTVAIGSATSNQVTFNSNWNSQSNKAYTLAGTLTRMAVFELLNKPQYIIGGPLQGNGECTDIYASVAQGFNNGFCNNAVATGKPLPDDVLTQYCQYITASETAQGITNKLNCRSLITTGSVIGSSTVKGAYLLNASSAIGATNYWWAAQGTSAGATSGYPSETDIRASCDLLVQAGFTITPSGNTCQNVAAAAQGTTILSSYPHLTLPAGKQIIAYDRTDPLRKAYGQILIDGLNFLYGTPNQTGGQTVCAVSYGVLGGPNGCNPAYYRFGQVFPIVFTDGANPDTWNIYMGAETFGVLPDNLYGVANSLFASTQCGGPAASVPSNYPLSCDPRADALSNVGEFQDTSQGVAIAFQHEVNIYQNVSYASVENVQADPVFNQLQKFVALNCMNFEPGLQGSLVNGFGTGWIAGSGGSFFTYLNSHKNPNYTPVNSAYNCTPDDSTLRVGQSQDSDTFNPFIANSVWDFNVIGELYDGMLNVNPVTGGPGLQTYNWMVSSHSSTFNPAESSTSPGQGTVVGTTTQTWHLRSDVQWQDGLPVTADDVCFSLLAYRDIVAALLFSAVANMAACTAINSSTVQVKLTSGGPNYDLNIGLEPIIPHKYWAAPCSWPVGSPEPDPVTVLQVSQCANPSYDPMASGILVGDSAFECLAVPTATNHGQLGGPCSQNSDGSPGTQVVSLGGKLLLTANPLYFRGGVATQAGGTTSNNAIPVQSVAGRYQKFSWADKFDAGVVSIGDLADAALHFKKYDSYWSHPLISSTKTCTDGTVTGLNCVDIGVISQIAAYIGVGAVAPLGLGATTGLDPHIDQFGVGGLSTGIYYLGCTDSPCLNSGSSTTVHLITTGTLPLASGTTTVADGQTVAGGAESSEVQSTCTAAAFAVGELIWTCTFSSSVVQDIEFHISTSTDSVVVTASPD